MPEELSKDCREEHDAFEAEWARFHPTSHPIGWMMRNRGREHWLRFHSLPESKRYAETEHERAIVLERANTIADEVLGTGAPVWLVQSCWDNPYSPTEATRGDPFAACRALRLRPSIQFVEDPNEEDPTIWRAHAILTVWASGEFNPLLESIAEDRAAPTLWMSAESGAVFAPYDGGVDLFLSSAAEAETLRHAHSGWLSIHREGL